MTENTAKKEEGQPIVDPQGARRRDNALWTPAFIVIVGCSLCCFLVGQGANAGTSVYLGRIGEDTGLAGIGAVVFSLAAAIGRIASGPVVDKLGRAVFMVAGAITMLFGTVGPLFDNTGILFIVWRTLQGLGFSICTTAGATAAADVLPLARLGEGIGYYGLGQAISMTVGPALAIFLISTDPPENFYVGLSIFAICALVFALCCRYEKHPLTLPKTAEYRTRYEEGDLPGQDADPSSDRRKSGLGAIVDAIFEPAALHGAVPMMFIAVAYGFGIFFVGVFGTSIEVASPGMFFTMAAITMIAVRLVSGRFMDKVRPIIIMGVAVLCALLVYGTFLLCDTMGPCAESEWLYYGSGLLYGISIGVAIPINQTVAVRASSPERWGAANGLFLLANDVAIGIASLICGFTVLAFGYAPTLMGIMVSVTASFFIAMAMYPKEDV